MFASNTFQDILVNGGINGIIKGNTCTGTLNAIALNAGSTNWDVSDNILGASSASVVTIAGTQNGIHDNQVLSGNIVEQAGANNNNIHDNNVAGGSITIVGTASVARNNPGFNPQGAATIAVTASPFTYTAGPTPETVYISGGTVSIVAKNAITLFTATNCNVNLEPHESLTVTYSVIPTMNKDRH